MYFMMMSLRSNISALPSISCGEGSGPVISNAAVAVTSQHSGRKDNTHVFAEEFDVRAEGLGIRLLDKPNDIIHRPGSNVVP